MTDLDSAHHLSDDGDHNKWSVAKFNKQKQIYSDQFTTSVPG